MTEREAMVKAVRDILIEEFMNTSPWDFNRASERVIGVVNQVSLDFEYAR